jgi:DNA-binding GntR family transcriptional regulator
MIVGRIVDNILHNPDTRGQVKSTVTQAGRRAGTSEAGAERRGDVYHQLRNDIVGGRFHPNERLVEADLAQEFKAGRSAIRSALVRLDQEGLVVLEPHRGARVRLVSDREALEIEEVRVILEQLIVRHAAQRVSAADLRDLRRSIDEMRRRLEEGNPMGYSELNAEFHQRIWRIADHQTAARLLANLKSQSLRFQYRTILRPGRTEQSLREHEHILEALAARDADASEAAMREHLSGVVETLRWSIEAQHRQPMWLPR